MSLTPEEKKNQYAMVFAKSMFGEKFEKWCAFFHALDERLQKIGLRMELVDFKINNMYWQTANLQFFNSQNELCCGAEVYGKVPMSKECRLLNKKNLEIANFTFDLDTLEVSQPADARTSTKKEAIANVVAEKIKTLLGLKEISTAQPFLSNPQDQPKLEKPDEQRLP
jgi:hypothetical protein